MRALPLIGLIVAFLPVVLASNPPSATLISPLNNNVTNQRNITFFCNATDDENVFRVDFYHGVNGAFALNQTRRIMELEADANTTLLCHFNGTYACDTGDLGENTTTSFENGKFLQGVLINGTDRLRYQTLNNIVIQRGTVEFWINAGFNTTFGSFFLADTDANDINDIEIRIDDGFLKFSVYDDSGSSMFARRNISSWKTGEWHHLAAVWDVNNPFPNDKNTDVFIDGSNSSNTYANTFSSTGTIGQYIYIGSQADSTLQANSTLDELRVSNKPRTPAEINISYLKGAGNHSLQALNFTVNNTPDGTYKWNCLAQDNQSQASFATGNFTVSVDVSTPPVVNNISFSPVSTDDIDPNVIVNATANVTDPSNITAVVFQWRETGDWNNDTMDFNSAAGLFVNASLTIDITGGVYFYRIWSNDTRGNGNFSPTQNFTANYDYTWLATPSGMGNVSGPVNVVRNIANITLNNTGDDTLSFSMTDDWPFSVFYNGSETPSFSVPAKNVSVVIVNLTFENQDSDRALTINVTASHASQTPSPLTRVVTGNVNSFTGGPYITVTISSIPTAVTQSTSGINITALIKNIGNETAVNVTVNWTVPFGWTNTTGSVNSLLVNLSASATSTSTLTFTVTSDATSGISSICVNATRAGNVTAGDCENAQVSCSNSDGICGAGCVYTNDNSCSAPVGSGGGGGGAGTSIGGSGTVRYGIGLAVTERADVARGETARIEVDAINTENRTLLYNVTLEVENFPQTLVKITPDILGNLSHDEKGIFFVDVTVPEYVSYGPHNITMKVKAATGKTNTSASISNFTIVNLFVHSATEEETLGLVKTAYGYAAEMSSLGLNVEGIDSLVVRLKASLDNFDYDLARELAEEIIDTRNRAVNVKSILDKIAASIEKSKGYGINATETQKMYSLALAAFERGDYQRAEERANRALLFEGIEISGGIIYSEITQKYWPVVLAIVLAAVASAFIARRKIALNAARTKMARLRKEEEKIRDRTRLLQNMFFEGREMGKEEYRQDLGQYGKRMAEIKKEISRLAAKRSGLLDAGNETDLERQKQHVTGLIREAQEQHFREGTLPKKAYNETVRQLKKELADIEKNIEKKSKGRGKKYAFMLIILLFFALPVFAQDNTSVPDNVTENTPVDNENRTIALNSINAAADAIKELQALGYRTTRVNDTLNEALILFGRNNYLGADSLARYAVVLKDTALRVDSVVNQVEARIYEAGDKGLDVSEARNIFDRGLDSFEEERYEEAEQLMKDALNKVDETESRQLVVAAVQEAEKNKLLTYVKENAHYIALAAAAAIFLAFLLRKLTEKQRIRKRIRSLEEEKRALENMARNVQRDYFENKKISKGDYEMARDRYRARLEEVRKELSVLGEKAA